MGSNQELYDSNNTATSVRWQFFLAEMGLYFRGKCVVIISVVDFYVGYRPSSFAQAAKLRRLAAAKEKELANRKAICSCSH